MIINITNIYFVRHAKANYENHDDLRRELTEQGMLDRQLVTTFLSDKSIDHILSSPYQRAIDTLIGFAEQYGFEIELVNDFRERKIDGVWIDDFHSFAQK